MEQKQKFKWSIHCSGCKRDIPSKRDRIEKWQGKTYHCRVCRKKEPADPKPVDSKHKEYGNMCEFCFKRGRTQAVKYKDGKKWLCKKCTKNLPEVKDGNSMR